MKNTVYGAVWASLVIGGAIFLGATYNPLQMSGYAREALPAAGALDQLKEIYDVSFIMDKTPSGNIVNYLPRLGFSDTEQIQALSELWGATGEASESESQYSFSDADGVLTIDKFGDRIVFTSSSPPARRDPPIIDDDEAVMLADDFMKSRLSFFNYEETVTSFDDGVYEVLFIDRLGNLKNFGFPATVMIDGAGNIYSAEVYLLTYDKLDSFPIKSMVDAYYDLPLDADGPIDLKGCSLVYYYRSSILQPCYLFEGDYADGRSFKAFVAAAIYN